MAVFDILYATESDLSQIFNEPILELIIKIFAFSFKCLSNFSVRNVVPTTLTLKVVLKDFISGVSIVFENKYSVGDNVTIGDFRGDVIELGMKTTKIRAYTGEVLIIPNHLVEKVINHSMSKSVAIVDIDVSYDSNLEKVEKVLEELCKNLTKELNGLKGEVQLLGINELASSSIKYRIIADTVPLKNYEIERKIKKELKIILDQNKIEIPYNQVVIHSAK